LFFPRSFSIDFFGEKRGLIKVSPVPRKKIATIFFQKGLNTGCYKHHLEMGRKNIHMNKILEILEERREGLTFQQLAEEYKARGWKFTDALLARNLKRLLKNGLIVKTPVEEDERLTYIYRLSDGYFKNLLKKQACEAVMKADKIYISPEHFYEAQDEVEDRSPDCGGKMWEIFYEITPLLQTLTKRVYQFEALRRLADFSELELGVLKSALPRYICRVAGLAGEEAAPDEMATLAAEAYFKNGLTEELKEAIAELILMLAEEEWSGALKHGFLTKQEELLCQRFFEVLASVNCAYVLPVSLTVYEKAAVTQALEKFERWMRGELQVEKAELERMQKIFASWVDYVKKHGFPKGEPPSEAELLLTLAEGRVQKANRALKLYQLCSAPLSWSFGVLTLGLIIKHHPNGRRLEFYEKLLALVQERLLRQAFV